MEVARTSMIHAAALHFLWPFAVRYAAHQLNLWPRVSLAETSPTLLWTGKVGDASRFRVDPPTPASVEVTGDSGPAASGAVPGGAELGGAESRGAEHEEPGGAASRGTTSGGDVPVCAEPGGAEYGGESPEGSETIVPWSPWSSRIRPRVPLTSQQLHEWYGRRQHPTPAPQGSPAGGSSTGVAGPGGARTGSAGVAGAGGGATRGAGAAEGTGAARGAGGAGGAGAAGGAGGAGDAWGAGAAEGTGAAGRAGATRAGGTAQPRNNRCGTVVTVEQASTKPLFLSTRFRTEHSTVTHLLATVVTDPSFESVVASALVTELVAFAAHCRLDYAACLVAESASVCPPSVGDPDAPDIPTPRSYAEEIAGEYSSQWQTAMDAEMASWKSTGTYVDEVPPLGANIVSGMWIFRVKRPPGSPPVFKARYVARGFSQRQGVDFFQTFSPTPKMTTLRVLMHVAAQRDYELHSLDLSTAFLQGTLHKEIWLRRPPGFTGSFAPGTQWSLRRPVYGLCQAPREWHDTLRTTLAALGLAPSTADPSLFLHTDTSLPPFYVLVYVDDLVFATADTEALALVKSELQKRHTCTDQGELHSYLGLQITRDRARHTITLTQSHMVQQVLQRFGFTWSSAHATPLATSHSLSAPPSDESVEPSGPYPELVGCL
ncbi:unnamed protein product, partial [Closterium sp. NIES-54]